MNKFFVFEGLDGCGKSTQVKKLAEYLKLKGEKVFITKEPTSSEIGSLIRSYLKKSEVDNKTLLHLYLADRNEHIKEIEYYLNRGYNVICDRYWYSSYAYQGEDDEKLKQQAFNLNKDFLKPDIIFYIGVDVNTCLKRINNRGLEKEVFESRLLLEQIKRNYLDLLSQKISLKDLKVFYIDGEQEEGPVSNEIKRIVEENT